MDDLISRKAAIDAICSACGNDCDKTEFVYNAPQWEQVIVCPEHYVLSTLPSAQPEITDEQAIDHLLSTGWMQSHDRKMYDMGLKKQLADDNGSYDSLLPSARPEIIRCKDCVNWDTTWQNDFAPNYHYCPLVDGTRRGDFYCADAEMRGEQDD